jgi:copper chaperone CopZ
MTTTATFAVAGMTCGHCVAAVTQELQKLPDVRDVTVDLVAGGESSVQVVSKRALDHAAVRAALDEAGYRLAGIDA